MTTFEEDNNYDQRIEDMKRSMALFKNELNELVETYLHPWIKDEIDNKIDKRKLDDELDLLGRMEYGDDDNTM